MKLIQLFYYNECYSLIIFYNLICEYVLYSIFNIAVIITGTYISSVKFKSCTKHKNLINEVDFSRKSVFIIFAGEISKNK